MLVIGIWTRSRPLGVEDTPSFTCARAGDLHEMKISRDWDLLETIGLLGLEDEVTGRLSAGQQRRVALTRLWHSQAPLWILDEPFTALDVKGIALLQQRFQTHLGQGGSIVMTSHQALSLASLNPKQRRLGETYANAMGAQS